jgi:hypothetical protein
MIIRNQFLLLILCSYVDTHYILYHSHIGQNSNKTFDCLYAYIIEDRKETTKQYIRNSHLIPYCRRPDYDEEIKDPIQGRRNDSSLG